jgi:hypothetical protein
MIEITSQNIETAKAMRVSSPGAKVKVRAGQLGVCTELSALGFTHFSADPQWWYFRRDLDRPARARP